MIIIMYDLFLTIDCFVQKDKIKAFYWCFFFFIISTSFDCNENVEYKSGKRLRKNSVSAKSTDLSEAKVLISKITPNAFTHAHVTFCKSLAVNEDAPGC